MTIGKQRRGGTHHATKLNADSVREIRRLAGSKHDEGGKWTYARLAARFGVSTVAIHKVVNRITWVAVV